MRRLILLFSLIFLGAGAIPAPGYASETRDYLLIFKGFSKTEAGGFTEYIVEFPGYEAHRFDMEKPPSVIYELRSSDTVEGVKDSVRRMLDYLGLKAIFGESDNVIVALREGFVELLPEITTSRGIRPVYRVGEKLEVEISVNRTAWIYCYYRQVDGAVLKLFPNFFHKNAKLEGGRKHQVPGDIIPYEMVFEPPLGTETLSCFASEYDLAGELPAALLGLDDPTVPPDLVGKLEGLFAGVGASRVALDIEVKP